MHQDEDPVSADRLSGSGHAPTRLRVWLVPLSMALLVPGAVVVMLQMAGEPTTAPASSGDRRSSSSDFFSCLGTSQRDGATDHNICVREAEDVKRRMALTERERAIATRDAEAAQEATRVRAALPCAPHCQNVTPGGSVPTYGSSDPTPVKRALAKAGYPQAVVRTARPSDPAPEASIIYGIPIGPACVVGHIVGIGRGGGYRIVGPLPGGQCIEP